MPDKLSVSGESSLNLRGANALFNPRKETGVTLCTRLLHKCLGQALSPARTVLFRRSDPLHARTLAKLFCDEKGEDAARVESTVRIGDRRWIDYPPP